MSAVMTRNDSHVRGRRRTGAQLAVVGALIAAGVGVGLAVGDGDSGITGDSGVGVRPGSDPVPASYQITYRTEFADAPVATESLLVERPMRSHFSSPTAERTTDLGMLATRSTEQRWLRLEVPIAPAGDDLRFDVVLDELVERGVVLDQDDDRTIAGRRCSTFRFGGPVSSGTLTPWSVDGPEHADACIDAAGLLLAEEWSIDGAVVRTRTATSVTIVDRAVEVEIPDDAETLDFAQGGGTIAEIDPTERPAFAEHWVLSELSDDFVLEGRFAVVPPELDRDPSGSTPRFTTVAMVSDVWVRGTDLLVLDQGAAKPGVEPPWDDRAVTDDIELDGIGPAVAVRDLRINEIRIERPDGGFVRLAGTLRVADLTRLAETLVLDPGGTP